MSAANSALRTGRDRVYVIGKLLIKVHSLQGMGLAQRLYEALEVRAQASGVTAAYLLTTTIEPLAKRWGFRPIDRTDVPAGILATREFAGACCLSAAPMVKELRPACGCSATG